MSILYLCVAGVYESQLFHVCTYWYLYLIGVNGSQLF